MADWSGLGNDGDVEDRRDNTKTVLGGGLISLVITGALLFLSGQSGDQILLTLIEQAISDSKSSQTTTTEGDPAYTQFVSEVLGSTSTFWETQFTTQGAIYTPPRFVLFRTSTQSGCGIATSSVGPHYCPADQTIYLDETFFNEIATQLEANTGDVAQAYVIAHEVGHHIQQLGGSFPEVKESIAIELQADCYAGAWAHSVKNIFDSADEINEALELASAIGDDRIQEKTEGQVNPETWTHGSAQQRTNWFNKGYTTGDPQVCTS